VKVAAGSRVRLALFPTAGDPDLFVFDSAARSVDESRSLRSLAATERINVRNRRGRTRTYYVAVGFDSDKQVELFNAGYRLRAR